MASRRHQRILALVTRRMHEMGCVLSSRDGDVGDIHRLTLALPSRVGRHRPDAIGTFADGRVGIGEAKTAADIASPRTREQFEDYLRPGEADYPRVFLGYPTSAEGSVRTLLRSLGAIDCPQLVLVSVPNELLDG